MSIATQPPLSPPGAVTAPRASLWAVAAGLIALGLLYHVSGGGWLIILLALGLIGPRFTNQRLETTTLLRWMVRVALIALIYQVSLGQDESGKSTPLAIGTVGVRTLFGELYAAEMVVQGWVRRDEGGRQQTLAVTLFSTLVYLTACNVFNEPIVGFITPVFMLLVAFALREWRPRAVADAVPSPLAARHRTLTAIQRVVVIVLTLGLGFAATRSVSVYKDTLNDLGNRFNIDQRMFENLGMSAQPELGSVFNLQGGTNRVLRVKNLAGDGHLRGATFNYYESGRWGPPLRRYNFTPATADLLSPLKPLYGSLPARQPDDMTITRLANMQLLFAPTNASSIATGESQDAKDAVEWSPEAGGIMRNRANAPYMYIVSVPGKARTYQGPLCQPVLSREGSSRDDFLQVPTDKGEEKQNGDSLFMRQLARKIVAGAPTASEKIMVVTEYLLNNHHYSLTIKVGPGDPVADFLRGKKDGHCEFFAASATLLLRYAGVPARYVTGYYAHEPGTEAGETVVRQRDAHAWCEAWVDGIGWVPVDATPGDGRPDEMVQDKISPFQRLTEWFQNLVQKVKDRLADIPPAVLNVIVVALALIPLAVYVIVVAARKRRARASVIRDSFAYTLSDETLAALSARFEGAFAKAGHPLAPESTYTEQLTNRSRAESVPAIQDALSGLGRQFARVYDLARFGGRRDRETFDTLNALVERIENNARANFRDEK